MIRKHCDTETKEADQRNKAGDTTRILKPVGEQERRETGTNDKQPDSRRRLSPKPEEDTEPATAEIPTYLAHAASSPETDDSPRERGNCISAKM